MVLCEARYAILVWSNLVSMLLVLGWLYQAAPLRVCSYYLLQEQEALGTACLCLAGGIVLAWLPTLFLGSSIAPHRPSPWETSSWGPAQVSGTRLPE